MFKQRLRTFLCGETLFTNASRCSARLSLLHARKGCDNPRSDIHQQGSVEVMADLLALKRSVRWQRLGVLLAWLIIVVTVSAALWLDLQPTLWYPWNVTKTLFRPKHWLYSLGFFALQAPVAILYSSLVVANEPPPLSLPRDMSETLSSCKTLFVKWLPLGLVQMLYHPPEEVHFNVPALLQQLWHSRPRHNIQHLFSTISDWQQIVKIILLGFATSASGTIYASVSNALYGSQAGKAGMNAVMIATCTTMLER